MNWEAFGAIAEFLGAIAVLLTLVYLSLQVRHTRDDIRRSIQQSRATAFRELMLEQTRNSDLQEAMLKVRKAYRPEMESLEELIDSAGLTDKEEMILGMNSMNFWLYRADVISNIEHLDANQKAHFDNGVINYGHGYGRLWFKEYKKRFPDLIAVRYVDKLIEQDGGGA